jgi:integrase
VQPIFAATETIAAHCDSCSCWCSNTSRTARSRTSGEYLFDVLDMTPSSQGLEPATFPERFRHLNVREALVKGRFTTPKSKTSRRLIELGPRTKRLLAQHWQATAYNSDDDLVFAHPSKCTPLDPARLAREHLKPALAKAGIVKPFRPFYDLRHTPPSPTKPPPATRSATSR